MSKSKQSSGKKKSQAEMANKLQGRDAPVKGDDKRGDKKISLLLKGTNETKKGVDKDNNSSQRERKVSLLLKGKTDPLKKGEENSKQPDKGSIETELEKARKRIAEVNKESTNRRLKLDELNKMLKSKEEREAQLKKELNISKQQDSKKEKELETLKAELTTFREQKKNTEAEALKQEENKKVELVKLAEMVSRKQSDPDILTLVQNANDNQTREMILNKLKNKKVDTVKVTGLSTLYGNDNKNIDLMSAKFSDISKLREDDPELYDDVVSKAKAILGSR
jgi:chromosome segregation ATPase